MRTSTWRRTLALCAVLGLVPVGSANAQKPPEVSVSRSIDVLERDHPQPQDGDAAAGDAEGARDRHHP